MLLKQLPSIVCALAAAWLGGVDAQDESDAKTDVKSIPVCAPSPVTDTMLRTPLLTSATA